MAFVVGVGSVGSGSGGGGGVDGYVLSLSSNFWMFSSIAVSRWLVEVVKEDIAVACASVGGEVGDGGDCRVASCFSNASKRALLVRLKVDKANWWPVGVIVECVDGEATVEGVGLAGWEGARGGWDKVGNSASLGLVMDGE